MEGSLPPDLQGTLFRVGPATVVAVLGVVMAVLMATESPPKARCVNPGALSMRWSYATARR
jgi:hypothetical protein